MWSPLNIYINIERTRNYGVVEKTPPKASFSRHAAFPQQLRNSSLFRFCVCHIRSGQRESLFYQSLPVNYLALLSRARNGNINGKQESELGEVTCLRTDILCREVLPNQQWGRELIYGIKTGFPLNCIRMTLSIEIPNLGWATLRLKWM